MKKIFLFVHFLMCAFLVVAQSSTLKVSNLNFRTGNSEVSYIEFFVNNPDVQAFRPVSAMSWNLDFADFAEKWSMYEPQFKAKIESMNMAFLNNTPQKCVAKIVMANKKAPQIVQQNIVTLSVTPVVAPILKEEIAVVEPQKTVIEKPTKVAERLLTPQESWEKARKEYTEVEMVIVDKEKSLKAINAKIDDFKKVIQKEKDTKKLKQLKSALEQHKAEDVALREYVVTMVGRKAELGSIIQVLETNNDIQFPNGRNDSKEVVAPANSTANIDNKLDVSVVKPNNKLDVPVVRPAVKPIEKEVVRVIESPKTEQVEVIKTPQNTSKIEVLNTNTAVETKVENVVVANTKVLEKVISDVSTSTISSSPMVEVVKKRHILRDCPDLELDSIWLAGVSKKWITVNAIVRNNSTNPQNMYGSTRFDDDNVAIRFYINSTENLTRGAIAGDGEYILGVLDKESGILQSDQTIKYTAKFSGEQRTKLTPFIIAELNPFGMIEECNPKNNYKTLKIEE